MAIATYGYFFICLLGRQPKLDDRSMETEITILFPIFTTFQMLFYVGWLKVGQFLMNPFGGNFAAPFIILFFLFFRGRRRLWYAILLIRELIAKVSFRFFNFKSGAFLKSLSDERSWIKEKRLEKIFLQINFGFAISMV